MIDLKTADFFIRLISFIISYFLVITIPNVVRARVSRWAGDDTPQLLGFDSLNPMHHVDPVGFIILIISSLWNSPLGWGRTVVTNPFNITSKLRLLLVYLSDIVTHFSLALVWLILLELMFGLEVLVLFQYMVLGRSLSHVLLAQAFGTTSSLTVSIGFILLVAIYLHVLLGVIYAILNGRDLYLVMTTKDPLAYEVARVHVSNFIIPLVLLLLFAAPLRFMVVAIISYVGFFLGLLLGLH